MNLSKLATLAFTMMLALGATPALAQSTSRDCRATAAFEQLTASDRSLLLSICRRGVAPEGSAAERLRDIIRQHVVTGQVSGLAIYNLLPPAAWQGGLERPTFPVAKGLGCSCVKADGLTKAFEKQVTDSNLGRPIEVCAHDHETRCVALKSYGGAAPIVMAFGGPNAWLLTLDHGSRSSPADVGGVSTAMADIDELKGPAALFLKASSEVGTGRVAPTTTLVSTQNLTNDWLETFRPNSAEPERYFVELEVLHDEHDAMPLVVLDGLPVAMKRDPQGKVLRAHLLFERLARPESWLTVDPNDRTHVLSVIGTGQDEAPVVLASRQLSLASLRLDSDPSTHVSSIALDLRRRAGAYRGLLEVSVAPHCREAGVDAVRLRSAVIETLSAMAPADLPPDCERVTDLRAWSERSEELSQLRAAVSSLGGTSVGADRGRLDISDLVGTAVKELYRQGMQRLTSVSVDCSRSTSGDGWSYALSGTEIDLARFLEKSRDYLAGIELSKVLETAVEVEGSLGHLRLAIDRVARRLAGRPSLTAVRIPRASSIRGPIPVAITVQAPDGLSEKKTEIELNLRALATAEDRAICTSLDDYGGLRDRRSPPVAQGGETAHVSMTLYAGPNDASAELAPLGAGTHLVTVRALIEGSKTPYADYSQCVEVTDTMPNFRVIAAAHGLWHSLDAFYEARRETYRQYRFLVTVPIGRLGFEALAGYAYATRHGKTSTNWNDIGRVTDPADPLPGYTVREHTFLFGVSYAKELNSCKSFGHCGRVGRRVGALLQTSGAFAAGLVDIGAVPIALRKFRGADEGDNWKFAPDLALGVGVGFRFRLWETTVVDLGLELASPRTYALLKKLDRDRTSARETAPITAGAFFGIGWSE